MLLYICGIRTATVILEPNMLRLVARLVLKNVLMIRASLPGVGRIPDVSGIQFRSCK